MTEGPQTTNGSPRGWGNQWAERHQSWYRWEEQDKATEDEMERSMPTESWMSQWEQRDRDWGRWKEQERHERARERTKKEQADDDEAEEVVNYRARQEPIAVSRFESDNGPIPGTWRCQGQSPGGRRHRNKGAEPQPTLAGGKRRQEWRRISERNQLPRSSAPGAAEAAATRCSSNPGKGM